MFALLQHYTFTCLHPARLQQTQEQVYLTLSTLQAINISPINFFFACGYLLTSRQEMKPATHYTRSARFIVNCAAHERPANALSGLQSLRVGGARARARAHRQHTLPACFSSVCMKLAFHLALTLRTLAQVTRTSSQQASLDTRGPVAQFV